MAATKDLSKQKRKAWTEESMEAAVNCIRNENKGLRETARLYNLPVETLRRHADGSVEPGCKPGPSTVLTEEEEEKLATYLIQMADMGFGLSRDTVMEMAFTIVEKTHRMHPFRDGKAGRAWFEGFRKRHPKLTLRSPQPLSYSRALCSNQETINDFFGKLGALYGRLNLISKPMLIFNSDETGISVVHKPGKVVAELGRRNVYAMTSAERGKTHTVLSCVSASGYALPPMMVYPRKKKVPSNLKEGALPGTLFTNSESGWINSQLYLEWFEFFLQNIPPTRPVLLLQDGHASHTSIELIELARANDIHLLCLPAHTTHVLQPLDVGVFKSFKSNFSKACSKYLAKYPGRVVTTDKLASLVAEAWPNSFTAVNVLSGFKKSGVYPLNPGQVTDRQLAPSKALCPPPEKTETTSTPGSPLFSPEQEALYQRRYEEHYDIQDPSYITWLKINHPKDVTSPIETSSSLSSGKRDSIKSSSSDVLSEVLVLPEPQVKTTRKKKTVLTTKTVCITEDEVLESLRMKEIEKREAEQVKKTKQFEREQKRKEREKREKEERKRAKAMERKRKKQETDGKTVEDLFAGMQLCEDESSEDDAVCPKCGAMYSADSGVWICCDGCESWYDLKCTNIRSRRNIPETFYCENCL